MIYVSDIVRLCGGKVVNGSEDVSLGIFSIDSRKVNKGDVYVGLRGEKVNGSDFYLDAIKKGAVVCIIDREYEKSTYGDVTIVVVDDTLKCLQDMARYKRSLFDIPVIAVTGSVGKTSCKDLIYSVLSEKYKTHKTSGNYNNHIGVPLTILGLSDDDEAMVIEMGMNHLGEISLLSKIACPDIGIITNVGTAHIGNLGSRENILKAKLEILDGMRGKDLVFNIDNDMLSLAYDRLRDRYDISTISIDNKSMYQAVIVESDAFSSKFRVNGDKDLMVNVGGKAYVYNALMAYAVGKKLGIDDDLIDKGILNFCLSEHRLEKKVNSKGVVIIDDTYNANYDSMCASLELLGNIRDKRRVAILGDMLELGDYGEKFHYDLGDNVISNKIDVLVTVGELSKNIDKRAMELGMSRDSIYHFSKESDTYSFLESKINEGDIVLVKGSHGIELVNVVDYLMKL